MCFMFLIFLRGPQNTNMLTIGQRCDLHNNVTFYISLYIILLD